ncbi:MAG: hypothetical protein C6Y22_30620 [Hapalosiphonaceae cyanobacterium JJU2]|nr:MAG: hypothetical protein C6Y22_30620 [Hapalosiphonaceae cyanobacterium JJU2]
MESDNLASSNGKKIITMIDIQHVATLKWGEAQARKLTELRGSTPRRQLEQKTTELGLKVAHQYIQQLEQPEYYANRLKSKTLTVSVDVVNILCKALNVDISYFFTIGQIFPVDN